MVSKIHLIVALTATLCIAIFFTATIVVEIWGSPDMIAMVKSLIVMPGLFVLVPTIAATGATGFVLAKTRKGRLIENKKKRMPFIAINGILILMPAAIFLDQWAAWFIGQSFLCGSGFGIGRWCNQPYLDVSQYA